jgi:hypothetical protein
MARRPRNVAADEDVLEQGYVGTTFDPIENEAYTLKGQGPETAQREREARSHLRATFQAASVESTTERSNTAASTSPGSGSSSGKGESEIS